MDFSLSDSQIKLQERMREFAATELIGAEKLTEFDLGLWRKCARAGIQSMPLPPPWSDTAAEDILTSIIAMEGLGHGCADNGLLFALNAHIWTVQAPVLQHGTHFQHERFLKEMGDGNLIAAQAMTEPEAGSDVFSLTTRAIHRGQDYCLTGRKCMISLAPVADVFLVFATTNPDAGRWGVSAFLVPRDTPGITVEQTTQKMGLDTVPMASIELQDCVVHESYRLGPEGAGAGIATSALEFERCCIMASQVGRMQRQLELAVEHARTRRQYGQAIGKFQSVSNRIADMKVRLETSRLMLYQTGWMKQQGQSVALQGAMVKLHLSEMFLASGIDSMRVHGGYGYLSDTGIEKDVRDAFGGVLYGGTSDIQRNIIAGMLGL